MTDADRHRAITGLLDDDREILTVMTTEGTFSTIAGCARIIAYVEPGPGCNIPWLAIVNHSDEVVHRIPAHSVIRITYRGALGCYLFPEPK